MTELLVGVSMDFPPLLFIFLPSYANIFFSCLSLLLNSLFSSNLHFLRYYQSTLFLLFFSQVRSCSYIFHVSFPIVHGMSNSVISILIFSIFPTQYWIKTTLTSL